MLEIRQWENPGRFLPDARQTDSLPVITFKPKPSGIFANPSFTAATLKPAIPSGFPKTSPKKTAMATGSAKAGRFNWTPALETANTGMMVKTTRGCRAVSRRSSGESVSRAVSGGGRLRFGSHGREGVSSPGRTPATVGWTPDFKTASQKPAPMITWIAMARTTSHPRRDCHDSVADRS